MEKPSCVSVFQHLGTNNPPPVPIFQRLETQKQPRVLVVQHLGNTSSSQSNKTQASKKWKVKRHTRVIFKKTEGSKPDESMEESVLVNYVSFEEEPDQDQALEFIDATQLAPPQMEDGGQATIDDLQEINLGTAEDPKPIFVKQAPRRFRPELAVQVKAEVDKLIDASFIQEVKYPTWLASIVPLNKKNGQICICIDYRDLNDTCPKDEFPLPITELLVDATTGYGALSFMDGFAGCNKIKMAPEDEELTAFRTPKGVYCYTIMPFGLKNAGATYQRAMTVIFSNMLHNTVECYVDNLVVKSRKRGHHLVDLRRVFERYRGIEIDPTKIKAIREMLPPRNLQELRGLQDRLAYIRRFISNLSGRYQPFTRLMKKDVPFVWDQTCQNAFDSIKEYLLKPPVLMALVKGKPLILYIVALERSLGPLLAQNNDEGKENALYYLSRTLVGAEHNYIPIEKFNIKYVSQKAIKGQALADFLAAHPVPDCMELLEDFPDEEVFSTEASTWQLYFDRAARKRGVGAGIVLITPYGGLIPYSFSLMAICSNNVVEYEALIISLEIALEMKIGSVQVYGDSQLLVKQVNDQYTVKNENLIPYHGRVKYLMAQFHEVYVSHIPRSENDKAEALANLAASLTLPDERDIQITVGEGRLLPPIFEQVEESQEIHAVSVFDVEEEPDWRKDMIK
ncbi:uncharacterized protein LOC112194490 [Rosa chinensis]|uniref:uncharacterized protein LOC112194490 n=1 Tax=Rosa chinensis TaxID=74649 RepID=UPI000D08F0C7|nr:uncharacterized protein LOC112194490 [Rosa chinensis]